MQFDELVKSIDQLGLTTELLSKANPRINWKGQPLSISHLPHYGSLHPKEAIVASTLRLTPVQYLTANHVKTFNLDHTMKSSQIHDIKLQNDNQINYLQS